jgi:DNA-binding PadR family transcriptional regulator
MAAMSQTSTKLVALGLVIEEPGNGYQIGLRMNERLASARFSEKAANVALRRAKEEGLVRKNSGEYEATRIGVQRFERWLLSSSALPPVREDLLARVALCQPKDMPRLIEVLRDDERACLAIVEGLNAQSRREAHAIAPQGWRRHIDMALMGADAEWWDARIAWVRVLREGVQKAWRAHQAEHDPGGLGRA